MPDERGRGNGKERLRVVGHTPNYLGLLRCEGGEAQAAFCAAPGPPASLCSSVEVGRVGVAGVSRQQFGVSPLGLICSVAKGLLRGIDHVEEAIFVLLLLVDLRDGGGNTHHAVLVHQQEEGLGGVQLQATSDYFYQFTHVDMVGD